MARTSLVLPSLTFSSEILHHRPASTFRFLVDSVFFLVSVFVVLVSGTLSEEGSVLSAVSGRGVEERDSMEMVERAMDRMDVESVSRLEDFVGESMFDELDNDVFEMESVGLCRVESSGTAGSEGDRFMASNSGVVIVEIAGVDLADARGVL